MEKLKKRLTIVFEEQFSEEEENYFDDPLNRL